MRRAGGVGVVARFGATLLGGVALLAWFELPARSQTSQGSNSLPPVTVDAPAQQSLRRAPAKRSDARVRSTSRRTTASGTPQPETAAVQPQPSQPGAVEPGTLDDLGVTVTRNENGPGLVVTNVEPNSAAATRGLQNGDIISSINSLQITGTADVTKAMADAASAGRKSVLVQIERDGQTSFVTLPAAKG